MKKLLLALFVLAGTCPLWSVSYERLGEGIKIQRNYRSGKKIAIATVIISGKQQDNAERYEDTTFKKIVSFGTKSKELYAKKHGYDLIVATKKLEDCYGVDARKVLECAWTKVPLVARILEDYDWVFFTDADSVILNLETRLEEFIDEAYDVIACDARFNEGPAPFISSMKLNTGQVFFKNCQFSKDLLFDTWRDHDLEISGSFEQPRINRLLRIDSERASHVLVYPGKAFNLTPSQYEPGDFLVHMYACHGKELYEKFIELEKTYGGYLQ